MDFRVKAVASILGGAAIRSAFSSWLIPKCVDKLIPEEAKHSYVNFFSGKEVFPDLTREHTDTFVKTIQGLEIVGDVVGVASSVGIYKALDGFDSLCAEVDSEDAENKDIEETEDEKVVEIEEEK